MVTKTAPKEAITKISEMLQKAATDEQLKQQLITNPKSLFNQEGVQLPEGLKLQVKSNKVNLLYFVVPTEKLDPEHQLFSLPKEPTFQQLAFYLITQIQENTKSKNEILNNPNGYLRKQTIIAPTDIKLEILQNSTTTHFLVVPARSSADTIYAEGQQKQAFQHAQEILLGIHSLVAQL